MISLLVAATLLLPPARQSAPSGCQAPAYRAFDFWVGDWDVVNPLDKPAGSSHVERLLDGCVIMEHWSTVGAPYAGKSFNTFNPSDGQWTQHWVDSTGASVLMTGKFDGDHLVYQRAFTRPDGTPVKARMTFFHLGADRVRQLVEQSVDGGSTWKTQIDLLYKRRA